MWSSSARQFVNPLALAANMSEMYKRSLWVALDMEALSKESGGKRTEAAQTTDISCGP
jgi:hypothetical protein